MSPGVIAAALFGASAGLTGGATWSYFLHRGAYKRGLFDGQLTAEQDTEWPQLVPDPEFIRALNRLYHPHQDAPQPAPAPPPSVFMTEQGEQQGHEAMTALGTELGRVLADMEAERIALHGDTDAVIASWEPAGTPETPGNPRSAP
jgi:hypothetical protein